MEDIETIYDNFIKKMAAHDKNHDLSVRFIKNQLSEIKKEYSLIKDETELYTHNSIFYLWDNSKSTFNIYDQRHITIKMLIADTINHQNIQYQWLLVSAFEDYEKYLRNIYAYLICINNKPNNINVKDFLTYFMEIHSILLENIDKKNASSILKEIRKLLPKYKYLETNNCQMIDMKFLLLLIQHFRHIIVHKNGSTNKEKLIDKLFSEIGITGKGKNEYLKIFNSYFPDNTNKIILLEIPVFSIGDVFVAETTVLPNLFSVMLNSAYFIKNEIKEKYGT
jgi:hypothetical protein